MDSVKRKKPLFVKFLVFFLAYSAYRYIAALIAPEMSASFNLFQRAGAEWFFFVSSFFGLTLALSSVGLYFAKQGFSYVTTKYFLVVNYLASFVYMIMSLANTDRFMAILRQYRPGRSDQTYDVMANPATLAIMLLATTVVYGLFLYYLHKNQEHFYYKRSTMDWDKIRPRLYTAASILVIFWTLVILISMVADFVKYGI